MGQSVKAIDQPVPASGLVTAYGPACPGPWARPARVTGPACLAYVGDLHGPAKQCPWADLLRFVGQRETVHGPACWVQMSLHATVLRANMEQYIDQPAGYKWASLLRIVGPHVIVHGPVCWVQMGRPATVCGPGWHNACADMLGTNGPVC